MTRTPIPPPGKAARNEQRKARAALINAISGAALIVGLVQPMFGDQPAGLNLLNAALSLIFALLGHAAAHGELRKLED